MNKDKKLVKKGLAGAVLALALVALVFLLNILTNAIGQSETEAPDIDAPSPFAASDEPSKPMPPEPMPEPVIQPAPAPISPPDKSEGADIDADAPSHDDEPPDDPVERSVANILELDEGLSDTLAAVARDFNCVAASLAFFDGESEYLTFQYGFADVGERRLVEEETKFRIASLSKLVVVILAMTLVEEGLLDLDTDISDYLGYEARNPFHPDTPITSRMLMQHTSSIYDTGAYQSGRLSYEADTTRNLLNMSTVHRDRLPGSQHEYSDFAFAVLGAVCEGVSGKLLDDLAAVALFEPIGIDAAFAAKNLQNKNIATLYNTSHDQSRSVQAQLNQGASGPLVHQHNMAIGNLTISALDFTRILVMLADGGVCDGVRVLSEGSVR